MKEIERKTPHACRICGVPFPESASPNQQYCETCRVRRKKEQNRRSHEMEREKNRKKAEHRCWICGVVLPPVRGMRYCEACAQIASAMKLPKRKEDALNKIEALRIAHDNRLERLTDAGYRVGEKRFSMQYTFDELVKLANHYHMSYGKFYAWINFHRRLPKEGEQTQ